MNVLRSMAVKPDGDFVNCNGHLAKELKMAIGITPTADRKSIVC